MSRRITQLSAWFTLDPVRARVVMFVLVVAVALSLALVTGTFTFADGVPGTGHP